MVLVLTWVSIYWFSRAGPAASVRIYYELALAGQLFSYPKMTVPVGMSFFPKELIRFPKACVCLPFPLPQLALIVEPDAPPVCYVLN